MKTLQNKPVQSQNSAREVAKMFGRIAGWYDFLNHGLSLGQDIYWRQRLVRSFDLIKTGRVLDLAAGTLDVTREVMLQHPEYEVLSLDFSLPMLLRGKKKIRGQRRILPAQADARSLPLPDACVDHVLIAFGIRNIMPRSAAYSEILRVLAPGGRLSILEFGSAQKQICKGLYNFYLQYLLPGIGKIFSGDAGAYAYLASSIRSFPEARTLSKELLDHGFSLVAHQPLCFGIVNLHWAKKADKGQ